MGGGGDTQSNRFDPPEWTRELYPGAMASLGQLAQTEYPMYAGMRVAPMGPWQHAAGQMTVDRALYGDPQLNAARGSLMNISQGGAQNPFIDNAYTEKMIADTGQNMADAFARGTAANNDALAAMGGAYGGSLHQQKQAIDAAEMAKQVGQMGTAARQAEIGRKGGLWQADVQNAMQAAGMAPQFSLIDQQSIDSMNQYGQQQQNYLQSLLSDQYGEWQRQQQYPMNMLDWYLSGLSRASGQFGTNYQTGGGQSAWPAVAGLGMTAASMWG